MILVLVIVVLISFVIQREMAWSKAIRELRAEHYKEVQKARLDAIKQSKNVLRGQLSEELIPLFPQFPYKLEDCRFLGSPIDYLILDGMSEFRDVDQSKEVTVILADVKYGTAARTKVQNAIRKAIQEGRIKFETLKVDDENNITIK